MKKLLKFIFVASILSIGGAMAVQAADVKLAIHNSSSVSIGLDSVPVCTGCTPASVASVASGSTATSTATANSDWTSMTYITEYYGRVGLSKIGCRATITLEIKNGLITKIIARSWISHVGPAICTETSAPTITNGGLRVTWGVNFSL